ncbi:MAG: hypothetical protein KDH96_00780 [Candidatus Riesia sp.]|nr:hypothetical protein [Candidatus Riesia sp.]
MSLWNILLGSKIKVYPQSALDYLIGSGIIVANAASMFAITDTDLIGLLLMVVYKGIIFI